MIKITFPDESIREFETGVSGIEITKSISTSLAKKAVAVSINGELCDLSDSIENDCTIEIVTREDDRSLELIRHDAAHVMAEAVQELWPETKVAIGPVIENGFYYDFMRPESFTPEDLPKIEKKMREIIQRNEAFSKEIWDRTAAKEYFMEQGEDYKVELVDMIPEGENIKIYRQGKWLDLCRGPHMVSTKQIGSAFKLMKLAGAFWRGDSDKEMLTRIYGTAWKNEADLKTYLETMEEAEKRDHRKLGREMDLFHFQPEGPGVAFWHSKGWTLFQNITNYMRRRLAADYEEVSAPQILDRSLWETSGHWEWYRENMFVTQTEDDRVFAIKPMNCPGHIQIFKQGLKSYRDLPVRLAEFGNVSRYEPSGALHGLMRVRAFTQDDAHVFCTEDQLADECLKINDLILSTYSDFGFDEIVVKFSTRPEKRVGSDESWDHAEAIMAEVLKTIEKQSEGKVETAILPGEGAFYGPKFEYTLRDAINREWQCGTTQVDFNLPERFNASYIDKDGMKNTPVMVHRAICGSMERFLGILIENYAGDFPLWLSPHQIVVATITSEADEYAETVYKKLKSAGLNATLDVRNEKINYKVREHSLVKVPIIIVCGMREAEAQTVNIRRFGNKEQQLVSLDEAIEMFRAEAIPPDLRN